MKKNKKLKIGLVVGSLRKGSFNRKIAQALIEMEPSALKFEIIDIGDLELYNEDLDKSKAPASWTAFRKKVKACAGVIFITPEYNRSVPGVLKNAVDVGSRPYGKSAWDKKPAGVISVSPGGMGGFGANHHLRQSLVFLDCPVLQQPEAYISGADKLFGETGHLKDTKVRELLEKFLKAYVKWVQRHAVDT